jgi:deoxyadenosine/deoxycytidine kinase
MDYLFLLKAPFDIVESRILSRGRIDEKDVNVKY